MRVIAVAVAIALIGLVGPSSASAAIQIGESFVPTDPCAADTTYMISGPGGAYSAPSNGVITSWSYQADGNPPTAMRLKVGRSAGGDDFTIIGQSDLESLAANQLNTFSTRVPVLAGDAIGNYFTSLSDTSNCVRAAPSYSDHYVPGDQAPGTTTTYTFETAYQFDLSAILEPDADNDGFGDETQDCAPSDPNRAEDCAAPAAAITKGPKNKTKKKQATFEFTGTDARAVASFQCSLDGGAFAPCTSPYKVRVKKGKHTFEVRAIDQAGNVGTPASDDWKRKKKRKK